MENQFNSFSIRRLNPFNGVLQVYQHKTARALSGNGLVWEIQVLSDTPQGLWANTPLSSQQYYTFGLWSEHDGLKNVPANPLFDIRGMTRATEALLERLQPTLSELPFPMIDSYELWLLEEQTRQPIALLLSCRSKREISLKNKILKWIAAEPGNFSFKSPHLAQRGLPEDDGYNPRVHASFLESVVRGRAGSLPQTEWVYRDQQGVGVTCCTSESPQRMALPELPITETGYDAENQPLISDYITWKAPQLLMLPNLSQASRDRLEKLAVAQAEVIGQLWQLYPEIHNKDLLKRARVEAKIRSANRK
jgi:hypothetical protein